MQHPHTAPNQQAPINPMLLWIGLGILIVGATSAVSGFGVQFGYPELVPPSIVVGVPITLWLYRLRRVQSLPQGGRARRRLVRAMWLSIAPLPLFMIHPLLRGGVVVEVLAWGWFCVWSSALLLMGGVIHAAGEWLVEGEAFARDRAAQLAWSPSKRTRYVRKAEAARWVQWTFIGVFGPVIPLMGLLTLLEDAPLPDDKRGVLIVWASLSALFGLVLMGLQLGWMRRLPQRGAVFHPGWTALDIILPWLMALFMAAAGVSLLLDDNADVACAVGGMAAGLALLFQLPAALIRRDKARWRAAWEADNQEQLLALSSSPSAPLRFTADRVALDMLTPLQVHAVTCAPEEASAQPARPIISGDPAFDARFDVSSPLSARGLAALSAEARAVMCALHHLGLQVRASTMTCSTPYPWQVRPAVRGLLRLARAWAPPSGEPWEGFVHLRRREDPKATDAALHAEWRLLQGALSDPSPTTRALCADALAEVWLRQHKLWANIYDQLADDPPSLPLITLCSSLESGDWVAALNDDTPWPAASAFAQWLWVEALSQWTKRAPTQPLAPRGRLTRLEPHFAIKAARAVQAVQAVQAVSAAAADAEAIALSALTAPVSPSNPHPHQVALCDILRVSGGLASLNPLRALTRTLSTDDTTREAARAAADAITARLNTDTLSGALALTPSTDRGGLALTPEG